MASSDKPESAHPIASRYSRLVRSLSKASTTTLLQSTIHAHGHADPSPDPPITATVSEPESSSTPSTAAVAPHAPAPQTAFERFIAMTERRWRDGKGPEFPPSAWFVEDVEAPADAIPVPPAPAPAPALADQEPGGRVQADGVLSKGGLSATETPTPEPEPISLARKIQDMIMSLPAVSIYPFAPPPPPNPPLIPNPSPSPEAPPPLVIPPTPAEGPPPTPSNVDSKLASFLSSASVMNGSISKGRQSVWSILERVRSPTTPANSPLHPKNPAANGGNEDGGGDGDDDGDDDSSVMMYAPLEPDDRSEVEIARSDICSVDEEGEVVSERPGEDMNTPRVQTRELHPADAGEGRKRQVGGDAAVPATGKGQDGKTAKKLREVRVWLPSATQISFQATWWGYRLYLPPPVLDVLGNKQLEAAKRAAMITTALKWLLDRLPINLFPPQFRPVLMIIQRLGPYLGYIGTFIAWSWAGIKGLDKGNGVILTATWLLPVALIPGTWDEHMVQPASPATPRPKAEAPKPSGTGSKGVGDDTKSGSLKSDGKSRKESKKSR